MTAALGGGYHYESPESRALSDFASDKFAYRDQGKNIIQLNNAVGFMSGMMRKMQRGIDDANKNFVQQIQGFITDFIVMLGGGGDTGLDFGDLKYVIQAIGALFGFADENGNITVPVNLFNAAWHFFTNFIGVTGNFSELIDQLIDAAISTVLDLFGEVPIIGQALQQLAAFISDIRDLLDPIAEAIQTFFDAFDIDLGNIDGITDLFGPFKPIVDALLSALDGIELPDFTAAFHLIAQWTTPFVQVIADVINAFSDVIKFFTGNGDLLGGGGIFSVFTNFLSIFSPISLINLLLGVVPIGSLGNTQPNLLVAPGFDYASNLATGSGWTYDASTGRTTNGCARATAGGIDRKLMSNGIPVAATQEFAISAWAKWTGLTFTGVPIRLQIIRTLNGILVGTDNIAVPAATPTNQATWVQLASNYTVPSGCDKIAVQFYVANTVTAGSVWFDDGSASKTGQIQQGWVSGLLDSLGGLGDIIEAVIGAILTGIGLIPFIGVPIATLISQLLGGIGDFHDDTQATAAQASDAYLGVQATQDIIVANTTNTPASGVADADVAAVLAAQTAVIAQQAAAIAALEQVQSSQSISGNSALEPFEYTNAFGLDIGLWDTTTFTEGSAAQGVIAIEDGHNAGMKLVSPSGIATQLCRYQGPENKTLTAYQLNTVVIAEPMQSYQYWGDSRMPCVDIYARVSDDKTKWTRWRWFFDGTARFEYKNGGAITQIGGDVATGLIPTVGNPFSIEAGTTTSVRQFRLRLGNRIIAAVTDAGSATDITQLGAGWGQRIDNGRLPGKITQFSMGDNAPPPTQGIGLRVFRDTATAINTVSGAAACPATTFNAIDRQTPGIEWDGEKATVTIAGWYLFGMRINNSYNPQASNSWAPQIYVKKTADPSPVLKIIGNSWVNPTTSTPVTFFVHSLGGDGMSCYCDVGDQIYPGLSTNAAWGIIGDAAGTNTWFSMIMLNRSLA